MPSISTRTRSPGASGPMTKDLAGLTSAPKPNVVNTWQFLDEVRHALDERIFKLEKWREPTEWME